MKLLHKFLSLILDSLYPPLCWECGSGVEGGVGLCLNCAGKILKIENYCLRCGAPSSEPLSSCLRCESKRLYYERAVSLFSYEGIIRRLIIAHKYMGDTSATTIIKRLIKEHLNVTFDIDAIVPVPQDERRYRRRGYDHLAPLLKTVSQTLPNRPPVVYLLRKTVSTAPQVILSEAMRKRNLIRAFEVIDRGLPKKSRLLLFDDVISTGATVKECARTLRNCGYIVNVLTIAR